MGWGPVEASIELGTSIGTILDLEDGPLDHTLEGRVIDRADTIFRRHQLAIHSTRACLEGDVYSPQIGCNCNGATAFCVVAPDAHGLIKEEHERPLPSKTYGTRR